MGILITTRTSLRHRIFLSCLLERMGAQVSGVVIQVDPQPPKAEARIGSVGSRARALPAFDEIRRLVQRAWGIGNHTFSHPTLVGLSEKEIDEQISRNHEALQAESTSPMKWLSYPNGAAKHVGQNVKSWMDTHPEWMGIHANGGVNFFPSRTEWLRIPVGNIGTDELGMAIRRNVHVTSLALTRIMERRDSE